jgi:hypothetical protein
VVGSILNAKQGGPGHLAPARLLSAAFLLAVLVLPGSAVLAQPPAAAAAIPIPDEAGLAKLVWSTMAAVDHANNTRNYTVLRALGSRDFQATNSEAQLAAAFFGLRQQGVNLIDTLAIEPEYEFPPRIEGGALRIRGAFRMRPQAVQFDLLYAWAPGWLLKGVAVRVVPFSSLPPTSR